MFGGVTGWVAVLLGVLTLLFVGLVFFFEEFEIDPNRRVVIRFCKVLGRIVIFRYTHQFECFRGVQCRTREQTDTDRLIWSVGLVLASDRFLEICDFTEERNRTCSDAVQLIQRIADVTGLPVLEAEDAPQTQWRRD